ncbi:MAG: hypothetical protein ABW199_08135 [Caulobacterales bacterium]
MRHRFLAPVGLALFLAACGQPHDSGAPAPTFAIEESATPEEQSSFPPVDPALLAAPNSTFTAIEPSEVGVIGAEQVLHAIEPLTSAEFGESGNVEVTVRNEGANAIADVVRGDLPDDAIGSAHVRVEFIPSPEGWFPANAYRRWQCRRAADPSAWSATPCP